MAAEMRLADRTPPDLDAVIAAGPLEGPAAEIGAIIGVQRLRQASDRSGCVNAAFGQPGGLVVDRVQQTKAY